MKVLSIAFLSAIAVLAVLVTAWNAIFVPAEARQASTHEIAADSAQPLQPRLQYQDILPSGETVEAALFTGRVGRSGPLDLDPVDLVDNTVTVETAAGDLQDGEIPSLTLTSNLSGTIVVTWTAPTKPTEAWTDFRINWGKSDADYPSFTSTEGNAYPAASARAHTLDNLDEGAEYKLRIRARYGTNWSGPWKETRITVASAPTLTDPVPTENQQNQQTPETQQSNTVTVETAQSDLVDGDVPTLTLTSDTDGEIEVTWTAPTRPTGENWTDFRINWAKAADSYPSFSSADGNAHPAASARSHTLTGLDDGVEYKVRMRARYGTGWSGPWKEARITVAGLSSAQQSSAALVFSPESLTLTEGGSASYTVKLSSEPSATVVVLVSGHSGSDLTLSGLSSNTLTFTTQNWDAAQTITVTAAEDTDTADDSVTLTHTPAGGGFSDAADLTVTVSDNDGSKILLSQPSLELTEGDTAGASYTVKLSSRPTATVTVTVSGHSGSDLSLSGLSNNRLTFTTQNWNTEQTITVTAAEDTDETHDSETLTHAPSGGGFSESVRLPVRILDDEAATPELVLSETALTVTEGDTTGLTYTVALSSAPSATMTVTVNGQTGSDLRLSGLTGNALTFTTDNWDTPQTVTVTAAEDDDERDDTVTLIHVLSGGTSLQTAGLIVSVFDDDRRKALVISEDTFTVNEGDTTGASFTVKLSSKPSGDVTVAVAGHSGTDLTVSGPTNDALTFTTDNWDTAQTVTVTAAEDADGTNDAEELTLSATGGGYAYAALLQVTVIDTKSILLEPATLDVAEGDASGATYTVKLASAPSATVTVTVSGHSGTDLSLSGLTNDALTFTTNNWNTAQTVTVTAAEDDDAVDGAVTLTHTPSGGGYEQTADLAVTIDDDEEAGLVFSEDTLTVPEGNTTGVTYTVKLASEPTADVTVTLSGHAGSDLSLSGLTDDALTFTTDNWDTAQSVTVTAAEDEDPLDDIGLLSHFASGGDYLLRQTLPVTITDDDTATPVTLETAEEDLRNFEIPRLTITSPVAGRIVATWTTPKVTQGTLMGFLLRWGPSRFTDYPHTNDNQWGMDAPARRYVISGLEAGVEYKVHLVAGDTNNHAGPAKEARITVSDLVVPDDTVITTDVSVIQITHPDIMMSRSAHARIPSLTLTSDKTGKIDVSWGDPQDIYGFPQKGFNINWKKADEEFYPPSSASDGWATADGDVRTHTISGLDIGVAYKVRVQSVNPSCCGRGDNWGGAWKEATITVASTTTVRIPGVEPAVTSASLSTPSSQLAPSELPSAIIEAGAGGEINLRWTKPRPTNQGYFRDYRVTWTLNDGSAFPGPTAREGNAFITDRDTTSHTITGLKAGEYKVRVGARINNTHHQWRQGPWREALIVVTPPPPEEPEEPEFAFQQTQELSTAAKALTHDGITWRTFLGDVYAVVSHNRVALEWAKRHGHAHVRQYKIWRKAPDDETYTLLGTTPEYHPTLGHRLAQELPPGALGSRSYYLDQRLSPRKPATTTRSRLEFQPDLDVVDAEIQRLGTVGALTSSTLKHTGQSGPNPPGSPLLVSNTERSEPQTIWLISTAVHNGPRRRWRPRRRTRLRPEQLRRSAPYPGSPTSMYRSPATALPMAIRRQPTVTRLWYGSNCAFETAEWPSSAHGWTAPFPGGTMGYLSARGYARSVSRSRRCSHVTSASVPPAAAKPTTSSPAWSWVCTLTRSSANRTPPTVTVRSGSAQGRCWPPCSSIPG